MKYLCIYDPFGCMENQIRKLLEQCTRNIFTIKEKGNNIHVYFPNADLNGMIVEYVRLKLRMTILDQTEKRITIGYR